MLLAIDAGNTNTVFTVFDGEEILGNWRCSTYGPRTRDEYFVWLNRLMAHHGVENANIDAAISNVIAQTSFIMGPDVAAFEASVGATRRTCRGRIRSLGC